MFVRKLGIAVAILGSSLVAGAPPAAAQSRDAAPKLVARCYSRDIRVTDRFDEFEAAAKAWMRTCVTSGREVGLVSDNASLRAVWDDVAHLKGTSTPARVNADFDFKGGGVRRVRFSTTSKKPASTPTPPPPLKPLLDPHQPLARDQYGELATGIARLRVVIEEDQRSPSPKLQGRQATRLLCQMNKLSDPKADDRVIQWIHACGIDLFGHMSGCDVKVAEKVWKEVATKDDIEKKNPWFITYERTELVTAARILERGTPSRVVAERLAALDNGIFQTSAGLERMKQRTHEAFFRGYLAMNNWVAEQQDDPMSVLACR